MADELEFTGAESEVSVEGSPEGSIPTKHLRAVYTAYFHGSMPEAFLCTVQHAGPSRPSWLGGVARPSLLGGGEVGKKFSFVGSSHSFSRARAMRVGWLEGRLESCPVYGCFTDEDNCIFYAWLLPEEIEQLSTKSGRDLLVSWVQRLRPPAHHEPYDVDHAEEEQETEDEGKDQEDKVHACKV